MSINNWKKELEQAKVEKDQFFRVKVVQIRKPGKKIVFKDGHEQQEIRAKKRSLTKKAEVAEKVKKMTNAKIHNLSKRERIMNDLLEKIRMAKKFGVITHDVFENLNRLVVSRKQHEFYGACDVVILNVCKDFVNHGIELNTEQQSNRNRLLTLKDCMTELMDVRY